MKRLSPFFLLLFILLNSLIKITNFGEGDLYYSDAAFRFRYASLYRQGKEVPRVDQKVHHPEGLIVRRLIHLTMDWVVGKSHLFFSKIGFKLPFPIYVKYFLSIFSSLSIIPLFFLGRFFWQSEMAGLISCLFYTLGIPSFWRITGNYLREAFTLPFLFTFLFFFFLSLERERRWERRLFFTLSGLFLTIGLISWHLSQFFFSVFSFFLFPLFIFKWKGQKEMLFFLIFPAVAGLVWEPLASKYFLLSFPFLASLWLSLLSYLPSPSRKKRLLFSLLFIPSFLFFSRLLPQYFKEYGHVFAIISQKIINLGRKPDDPSRLSFDARAIWTGPFVSPGPLSFFFSLSIPFLFGLFGWLASFRLNRYRLFFLSFFLFAFGLLYLLVIRLEVFFFFFLSLGAGGVWLFLQKRRWVIILLLLGLLFETYKLVAYPKLFSRLYLKLANEWSIHPTAFGQDWNSLKDWIEKNTKENEAFLADVDISAMLCAYTGRPIVIQPIYEIEEARRRVEECLSFLYLTEAEFFSLIKRYQVRYFIYQKDFLLDNSKAGTRYLTTHRKVRKNSTAYLMHFQPESLKKFLLVHQTNTFRIYRVLEEGEERKLGSFSYSPYFDLTLFPQGDSQFFDDSRTKELEDKVLKSLAHYNSAIQLMKKKEYHKAIGHFLKVLSNFPELEETNYLLALCYEAIGEKKKALTHLEKAISYNPNKKELYSTLGFLYLRENKINEGLLIFQRLSSLIPENPLLHLYTGYLYAYKNDLANAEKEFLTAKGLDSTNPEVYEALGSLYLQRGEKERAKGEFRRSLQLNPNQEELKVRLKDLEGR